MDETNIPNKTIFQINNILNSDVSNLIHGKATKYLLFDMHSYTHQLKSNFSIILDLSLIRIKKKGIYKMNKTNIADIF